ncbi:MAG: type IV pilus twitching motility protein PilT [Phycisphaerales bacterium]
MSSHTDPHGAPTPPPPALPPLGTGGPGPAPGGAGGSGVHAAHQLVSGHVSIHKLLLGMRKVNASDLHIKVGMPPIYRVGGLLKVLPMDPLGPDEADHLLDPIVPEALAARFATSGDLDFACYNAEGDRFRVNMFRAGAHVAAAIRRVKADIPDFKQLHLPPIYADLVEKTNEGLILVVGVTGCGKSSTLAAMINHINHTQAVHIITVEDPVEYRFIPDKAIISQRELGIDVPDYRTALRYIVRQDPDIVFIGELRDLDTVMAAIQAAETGHLVFATMHTADTMQSFGRMLEFFPQSERAFVRSALGTSLKAIMAQRLLPAVENFEVSVVPATEVLLNNAICRAKILEGDDGALPSVIAGSTNEGMRSFTTSLAELVNKDWVSKRVAMEYAPNREALDSILKGMQVKASTMVGKLKM